MTLVSWTAEEPGDAWVIRNPAGFVQGCAELDAYTFLMTLCFLGFSMHEFA